ncbi:conserved hypothetical protein [Thermosulfidibacter takaii ABI70S6]|uniref:Permease n=1 Tax=Thermosulfidibacter takaii (strain DSM 17441 / JCM 13301 / NBRC 103674 / ABI70S6) TaxID=1298851 RepID=A0A0S3QUB9_THET7|nr:permease [Thermosulfidibacter takaii]BAT71930.1 conserved hypothetical protein [Thermosulfidibacter takaii ABI70S6]
MNRVTVKRVVIIGGYFAFVVLSYFLDFRPGVEIGKNFVTFALDMLKVLPFAFVLIGLFEVWVKKETIERHFGEGSGIWGYVWAILLAGTTVGGLYVAFPVAYALYQKGAKISVVFTYIGAAAVCRIPMTIFEASFLGIKFSLIRLGVSIPLVVLTSIILGNYLSKKGFKIKSP